MFATNGRLIWRNLAAAYFKARSKKQGIALPGPTTPIDGQISRVLRLGTAGRTSLSRVQFMVGAKPASATCACTPLEWEDGSTALLMVAVDPVDQETLDSGVADLSEDFALWRGGAVGDEPAEGEAVVGETVEPTTSDGAPPEEVVPDDISPKAEPLPDEAPIAEPPPRSLQTNTDSDVHRQLADQMARLVAEQPSEAEAQDDGDELGEIEALASETAVELELASAEPEPETTATDNAEPLLEEQTEAPTEPAKPVAADAAEEATIDEPVEESDAASSAPAPAPAGLYRIIGRYLRDVDVPLDGAMLREQTEADRDIGALSQLDGIDIDAPEEEDEAGEDHIDQQAPETEQFTQEESADEPGANAGASAADWEDDAEKDAPAGRDTYLPRNDRGALERATRYNFDELSRILNDRVGELTPPTAEEAEKLANAPAGSVLAQQRERPSSASLINLGGETLVLNRLPLGILVFRDQDVLFANRAITEMTGYDSVESLRMAGLGAIFPGDEGQDAGPVNHLVQQDGTLVPVTARLQSVSWQGRPALMLSASTTEVRTGHEGAVKAFAQAFAESREEGFIETNRSGLIVSVSPRAEDIAGIDSGSWVGRPISELVSGENRMALREFLERPARFAETERPSFHARITGSSARLSLFAQGQAGIISGYFGVIDALAAGGATRLKPGEPDPALLARVSRGVRRPLNSIIGFADMLARQAAAGIDHRTDYAEDIRTAGLEIAALVDELDDYARLKEGRYLAQRVSMDLMGLLESCVLRIRKQAGVRRVIVRNAISEKLPRVTADRASLAQAVLNLLASAIEQTPMGGAVVISAQRTDEGGIAIHVRDNSENSTDLSERFVVFRDGTTQDGRALAPVRSNVGLALTRSLLAVNAFSLSVDPAGAKGMLFTMLIPAELVAEERR
ncbi:hypothetical protein GCM10007989_28930 [Devosia pacifica]|uniref:histidine kinase n=1 Tax=Devosia pacifica TaxID=1335967 RepID=A0A918VX02_9HYPH|nr:hypothetical protein GCM10007989_28930 [Devosia pacifica]